MSNVCCKEFKGWCKSFTRTEIYLSLIQFLFLVVLIVSLTFLILHLIACFLNKEIHYNKVNNTTVNRNTITAETSTLTSTLTTAITTTKSIKQIQLAKKVECTWKPSQKTKAATHYYDVNITKTPKQYVNNTVQIEHFDNRLDEEEIFDDKEDAEEVKKGFFLALVRIKSPDDVVFGCVLTILTLQWTITAASCLEAIEEVDSLDSFVMMKHFGDGNIGEIYSVSDVLVHPEYQGVNITYDLAALKSEQNILKDGSNIVALPTLVDYLLTTIGQKFSIFGYGKFRTADVDSVSSSVWEASVYRVPAEQCPGGWAPRHLWGGRAVRRGAGRAGALCATVARGAGPGGGGQCRQCAGAPLLRGRLLLALLAHNPRCGLDCEPALYVNLALHRDWLDSVIHADHI